MPKSKDPSFKLNQLCDNRGATKTPKRKGRGPASGTGKTAGRGHKGQKSRSGTSLAGQNGGQTPIYKQLPKRGMRIGVIRKQREREITLKSLIWAVERGQISQGQIVDHEFLIELGALRSRDHFVLLGNEEEHIVRLSRFLGAIFPDRISRGIRDARDLDGLPVITSRPPTMRKIVRLPLSIEGTEGMAEIRFEVVGLDLKIELNLLEAKCSESKWKDITFGFHSNCGLFESIKMDPMEDTMGNVKLLPKDVEIAMDLEVFVKSDKVYRGYFAI